MNDDQFAELLESTREGGAILRGEKAPSRRFEVEELDELAEQSLETDWEQLDAMTDEDIDLSDIPEITLEMFARMVVCRPPESSSN